MGDRDEKHADITVFLFISRRRIAKVAPIVPTRLDLIVFRRRINENSAKRINSILMQKSLRLGV